MGSEMCIRDSYTRDWSFYVGLALVLIVLVARGGIAGVLLGRHRNV